MRFVETVADKGIKHRIVEMADGGMVGHALMLHEDEGGGGLTLAVALAQYLLCENRHDGDSCGQCSACSRVSRLIHPDLHFAFPVSASSRSSSDKKPTSENYMEQWRELYAANPYFTEQQLYDALGMESKSGNISVAEAKRIIERLTLTALEGYYKIMVIWLPERMNSEAANKLLKILEEPYEGTLFILVTQAPEKVISTISSRCRHLRVPPMPRAELAAELEHRFSLAHEDALSVAASSSGSFGKACMRISGNADTEEYREILKSLIDASLSKDLYGAVLCGERAAALPGREKQKAFCTYACSFVRNMLMIRNGLSSIADADSDETEYISKTAFSVRQDFFDKAIAAMDRAYMLIDRNVSAKTVFCDLADRFYLYI